MVSIKVDDMDITEEKSGRDSIMAKNLLIVEKKTYLQDDGNKLR